MQTQPSTTQTSAKAPLPAPVAHLAADVEGLRGVRGTMLVTVRGTPIGVLAVEDTRAEFLPGATRGDVTSDFDDPADIRGLLQGELNPVVAGLQRRLLLYGNLTLGAQIILGLRTGARFEPVMDEQKE